MPTWKKLVVSGSNISQLVNDVNYVINSQDAASLSGSFSGSFYGDGSGLTNVLASQIEFANVLNKPTLVSGSSQIDITNVDGYSAFSQSIDSHLDANIAVLSSNISNLSSSVDAHLDANISLVNYNINSLSGSAHSQREALYSSLNSDLTNVSSSAHLQRLAIESDLNLDISNLSGSAHSQRVSIANSLSSDLTNVSASFEVTQAAQDLRIGDLEAFSSSLDASFATDESVTNLSASVDAHLDANISAVNTSISNLSGSAQAQREAQYSSLTSAITNLSSSVDAHLDANISALSSSAATANTQLSSSIASTVSGLSQTLSISGSSGDLDLDLKTQDLTITGDGFGITTTATGNTISVQANGLLSSSAQVVTKLSNQSVNFGSGNITAATFSGNGANLTNIPLGTATTGDYVESLVAGTGITITNNSGEGATPTIATAQNIADSASPTFNNLTLTGDLNVSGTTTTTNQTTLTVSDSKIFLADGNTGDSLDTAIIFNYNDGVDDTAGIFRDATDGSITFFGAYTGSDHVGNTIDTTNANYSLGVVKAAEFDGNVAWNNITDRPDPKITVNLAGHVTGTGETTLTDLADGILNISSSIPATTNLTLNDLTIDGNLVVSGVTTTVNSSTISSDSPLVILNTSGSGNPDVGVIGKYDESGTTLLNGFFRDATDGVWKVFDGSTQSADDSSIIDTSNAGFSLGTIQASAFSGSLDWSYLQNVPDPKITVNVSGDVSGSANTTLTDLADGVINLNLDIPTTSNLTFNNLTVSNNLTVTGNTTTDDLVASGNITGSNFRATGDAVVGGDVNVTGDISGNNLTLAGNLTVAGTTTTVNSTTVEIGDNILSLNGTGATNAGLIVNDPDGPASGSFIWKGDQNAWFAGGEGSEVKVLLAEGDDIVSGSSQVNISQTTGYTSFSASIDSHLDANISAVNTSISNVSSSAHSQRIALISDLSASAATANTNLSSSIASTVSGLSQTLTLATDSGTDGIDLKTETLSIDGDGRGIVTSLDPVTNTITVSGNGLISGSAQISGDIDVTNLNATSITGSVISASAFVGDGSQLTGLTVDQSATIASAFTNVTTTTVNHNFNSRNVNIVVYDSNYKQIIPASVTLSTTNSAVVEFCEATTGTVVVAKGGHILSGSVSAANIDGLSDAINTYLDLDGVVSSSVQVDIASTTGYSAFSSSIDSHLDANITALSSSIASTVSGLSQTLTVAGDAGTDGIDLKTETLNIEGDGGGITTSIDAASNTISLVSNGVVSGSSQVDITGTTGYAAFSSSVDAHLDANIGSVNSSINNLSGSAHSQRVSLVNALSSSAAQANTALSASVDAHLDAVVSSNITSLSASAATANANLYSDITSDISALSSSVDAHLDSNISVVNNRINSVSSSIANTIGNITTELAISGSSGNDTINLDTAALTIAGTNGEIETVVTNNQVKVGIVDNPILTGNVTVTGNLTVQGDTVQAQVANLNVEDRFILLNSGSNSGDSGIIFGGSDGAANQGSGIFWDSPANIFGFAGGISGTSVTATHEAKLGYIQQDATLAPSAAPSFQGVGAIHIKEDTGCIYIYA